MVKTLVEPIHNTSRKFTCDRYFTAVELFEHLLNVKLTSVGTVMPNRKHFPIALTTKGNREINSTLFAVKDLGSKKRIVSASFVNPSSNQRNCKK